MELKKIHISDIGKVVTGKTPRTSIAENYGGNIPFLTPSDDLSYKSVPKTGKTLTEQGLNEVKNYLLPPHSVCVSCIGSDLGKVVMTLEPTITNQQFNSIIPNRQFNADFVYYLMTLVGKELNYLSKTSTAVPIINKSSFSNYEVKVPDFEAQKKIASILSPLDDKIELNRRINRNLEQQAQALFKAWFVDFEPFKNGKFVDSELGRIPEGWKIGLLNELIELQSGFAFKSDTFVEEGEYRLITIKAVQDGYLDISGASYINEVPTKMPHYCFLQIGDMLLSLTGNVGRVCIVSYNNLLLNQRVAKIKPIKEMDRMFTYTLFRRNEFKNRLIYLAKGTAQLNLSPIETIKQKVIIPPRHILNRYGTIANIMYDSIIEKMQESIALTNLRDTLLPRLMSGELNVNTITE